MEKAYVCDFIRTPIGRYGGALASVRPDDLGAHVLRALVERNLRVDWAMLDDVVFGCANQAGEDNRNVARMALLLAGLDPAVPGQTVNRLCGSGMDAVIAAARAIKAGEGDLYIAGGVESMTRAPFVTPKAATPFSRRAELYDTTIGWRFVNAAMESQYGVESMPETAENVAADFDVNRRDQDLFALRSQQKAAAGQESGFFAGEICPVRIKVRKKEDVVVDRDEHPRGDTSIEKLEALPTPFREGGTVTAGNSSGVNDGAAALLIASGRAVERFRLRPLAAVSGAAHAGVAPRIMGVGPTPATARLCERLGLSIGDFDVIELNEAFAAQSLAVTRSWGLPDDAAHVNPNGGAIALGHPLGASGARIVGTAARQLAGGAGDRALATMCVGVGQGVAVALESVS